MKKIIFFMIILMCFSIPINGIDLPAEIKIGLKFGATAVSSVELSNTTGLFLNTGAGEPISLGQKTLIAKRQDGGFVVSGAGEFAEETITIFSAEDKISVLGKEYRGYITLKRQGSSDITVINGIGFEKYLYGVVGKEMSPSFHIESLKAQAICARTYAFKNLDKYRSQGFNLSDATDCQAYNGVAAEAASIIRAVDETAGKIIVYDGKPIEAVYFSSDGGATENSENVWISPFPYLKSVPDPYENPKEASYYNWTVAMTPVQIKDSFAQRGIDIGEITDILITEVSPSGRALKLVFKGTTGEKIYTKDNIRAALGTGVIKSQLFTIRSPASSSATVLTGDGKKSVTVSNVSVLTGSGKERIVPKGGNYVFTGHGWGHAVGMSQWGAKGMADSGFTYEQILKHYYSGVEVK